MAGLHSHAVTVADVAADFNVAVARIAWCAAWHYYQRAESARYDVEEEAAGFVGWLLGTDSTWPSAQRRMRKLRDDFVGKFSKGSKETREKDLIHLENTIRSIISEYRSEGMVQLARCDDKKHLEGRLHEYLQQHKHYRNVGSGGWQKSVWVCVEGDPTTVIPEKDLLDLLYEDGRKEKPLCPRLTAERNRYGSKRRDSLISEENLAQYVSGLYKLTKTRRRGASACAIQFDAMVQCLSGMLGIGGIVEESLEAKRESKTETFAKTELDIWKKGNVVSTSQRLHDAEKQRCADKAANELVQSLDPLNHKVLREVIHEYFVDPEKRVAKRKGLLDRIMQATNLGHSAADVRRLKIFEELRLHLPLECEPDDLMMAVRLRLDGTLGRAR
ncbi:MAG TPA: hypothetical protein PKM88_05155 [bacterium]|nr:hypothetical protein [bacterium]